MTISLEQRNARRNELAAEFGVTCPPTYEGISDAAQQAIDRIIDMEDGAA